MNNGNPNSYALKEDVVRERVESCGVKFIRCWLGLKGKGPRTATHVSFKCKICDKETHALLANLYKVQNCRQCGIAKKSGPKCYMWNPDREQVASNKYWRKACGRMVRRCVKLIGSTKEDHTYTILGYTPKQLQEHIMNHPNGVDTTKPFHIDHIFPVQAFLDHGIFDLRIMNCLDNLQPLPGPDNLAKADGYDKKTFQNWINANAATV